MTVSAAAKASPAGGAAPRKRPSKAPKTGGLAAIAAKSAEAIEQSEKQDKADAKTAKKAKPAKPKPRTRVNKKGLVLYVDKEVARALRLLSITADKSVQTLGMTALNMLFAAHKMATFPLEAPSSADRAETK